MKGHQILQHGAVFIVILSSGLYGIGYAFQDAYLKHLGFNIVQFPPAVHELLFTGFFASMDLSVSIYSPLVFLGFGVFIVSIVSTALGRYLQKTEFVKNRLSKYLQTKSGAGAVRENSLTVFGMNVLMSVLIAMFVILALALLMVFSANIGQKYGMKFIENASNGHHQLYTVEHSNSAELFEGYIVECSSSQCAFYNKDPKGQPQVFNKSDVRLQASQGRK